MMDYLFAEGRKSPQVDSQRQRSVSVFSTFSVCAAGEDVYISDCCERS